MTSTVDDHLLDEEWLAAPRTRSRARLVMVSALIASLCFLGGALTQKHLGATAPAAAGPGGFPAGAPAGLGGGSGGPPSGGFPGAGQQGAAASDGTSGATADATDQVIGTVVKKSGDVWVVEDLGGTRHRVAIVDDTHVVREAELTPRQVTTGDRVQITGVTRADRLEAADITLR